MKKFNRSIAVTMMIIGALSPMTMLAGSPPDCGACGMTGTVAGPFHDVGMFVGMIVLHIAQWFIS